MKTDILIIGGGIVGLAIANELAGYSLRAILLEKETEISFGVSKSNSGIIHTGFQSDPAMLKTRLAIRGNTLYKELAKALNFRLVKTGELVVAFPGEEQALEGLRKNGEMLGIPGIKIVNRSWLRKHEPNLSSDIKNALLAPSAAVINPYEVIHAMAGNAFAHGIEIFCEEEVTGLKKKGDLWIVFTKKGRFETKWVINAAGLYADKIARTAGLEVPKITPWKGEEFILDRHAGMLTRRIIFPLPQKETKGVLVIPTVDGNTMIGPTAEKIRDREDRSTSSSGRQEVIEAVRRLIPSFKDDQVIASFGGLRPKIEGDDFYIHEDMEGLINIIGTQSPGLTAAPAISEYVVKLIAHKLSLRPKRPYSPSPSEIIRFRQCNVAERNGLIKKDPYFGEVICRCEMVTKGEIKEAIRMGARTMDGIKFRTRAQMGRCQGSFCTMKVMAILAEELAVPYDSITKRGRGSELVKGYV